MPLLWGLLAAVLRFIPGLGTWMAAVIPVGIICDAGCGSNQRVDPDGMLGICSLFDRVRSFQPSHWAFHRVAMIWPAFWTWLWACLGWFWQPVVCACGAGQPTCPFSISFMLCCA